MTQKRLSMIVDDIKHWLKAHWFLCLAVIGFILIWRAAEIGIREGGNIYPSLLLLLPLLITFLLFFLVVIYEDMAT